MVLFMRGHHLILLSQIEWLKVKNRTLTEMVNAILKIAKLPWEWSGETMLTSCHTLDRVLVKNKEKTPFEVRETLSYLCTWVYLAKVNVPIPKKCKFG